MREMKKYHLAHHYKNFELGFGVTSALSTSVYSDLVLIFSKLEFYLGKIWDVLFNTILPV